MKNLLLISLFALAFSPSCKDGEIETPANKDCRLVEELISFRSDNLSFDGKVRYIYNTEGNVIKEQNYNADTVTSETIYKWDSEGRLIAYGDRLTYTYDQYGYRIARQVNRDSSVEFIRVSMHGEGSDTIWEYDEGSSIPHTIRIRFYENGNPVRELFKRDHGSDGTIDETFEELNFFDDKRFSHSSIPSTYFPKWQKNNHLYTQKADGSTTRPKEYQYNEEGYASQKTTGPYTFRYVYECD